VVVRPRIRICPPAQPASQPSASGTCPGPTVNGMCWQAAARELEMLRSSLSRGGASCLHAPH
jgi:hypothetical protein